MFKTTIAAAALLAIAGTAQAQTGAEYCQFISAFLWSNTLDALENLLRQRTYDACMRDPVAYAAQIRQSMAPPAKPPTQSCDQCVRSGATNCHAQCIGG
jgi:hypothetical protein